ncbi:response regulator [Aggregatilineales bacterium SYSU G02658]
MNKIPKVFDGWPVLVADDERDSLEVARRLLKLAGAQVTTANNGQEALDILRENTQEFRFILTDLSMPGVDGWELLYEIKNNPQTAHTPVIALTAHAMAGDRERGIAAGFHNYITKPLEPTKFIQQLTTMLSDVPHLTRLLVSF